MANGNIVFFTNGQSVYLTYEGDDVNEETLVTIRAGYQDVDLSGKFKDLFAPQPPKRLNWRVPIAIGVFERYGLGSEDISLIVRARLANEPQLLEDISVLAMESVESPHLRADKIGALQRLGKSTESFAFNAIVKMGMYDADEEVRLCVAEILIQKMDISLPYLKAMMMNDPSEMVIHKIVDAVPKRIDREAWINLRGAKYLGLRTNEEHATQPPPNNFLRESLRRSIRDAMFRTARNRMFR